jgi:hypothetical protein
MFLVCLRDYHVRTVVLPALSRPRKSSLACLFASPSWASMSQTTQWHIRQHPVCSRLLFPFRPPWTCASPRCRCSSGARGPNVHQSTIHILSYSFLFVGLCWRFVSVGVGSRV